ncbi:BA75_04310T0 [Komagataella pastoris]|uniref:BA75_04310T0 n=1 Tax=Komagataella pastoris TaxID=4922 RepID=A0A1B2JG66_PICPA|nr:BA75_04310T0 [Komagataella pastoris]
MSSEKESRSESKSSQVLNIPKNERVRLTVRNLQVTLKVQKKKQSLLKRLRKSKQDNTIDEEAPPQKKIISNVNLDLKEGELIAILGSSGSGKTTLLNTLSQKVTKNKSFLFSGMIKYNENTDIERVRHAYMTQTDFFLPNLTVYETLDYAAKLKLPRNYTDAERTELVESILVELGLDRIRESIICNSFGSIYLSGGEQRLVSMALQLLNKPGLLFLDEPTTGLDATSSFRIMTALHKLSKNFGMTIVLTIHQPRYEILKQVDRICILTRGCRIIYNGSPLNSIEYFKSIGHDVPTNVNLTDYLLDISCKDSSSPEKETQSLARIEYLASKWEKHEPSTLEEGVEVMDSFTHSSNSAKALTDIEKRITVFKQIIILTKRTFILSLRDRGSMLTFNFSILIMGVACGWLFFKPPADLGGIRSIVSQVYVVLELIGFVPMILEITRLWDFDGQAFLRENSEGYVSVTGWIVSRRLAKFPIEDFPTSIFFALITYFMFGLRTDNGASNFLIYFVVTLFVNLCAVALATFCFAVGSDFAASSLMCNVIYQLQNSSCGYFINAKTMPVYVRWLKYCAHFWYAFGCLMSNQFTDWMGDCPTEGDACVEYSGIYQLEIFGFGEDWITLPICVLLAFFIGTLVLSGIILRYKNTEVSMSKEITSNMFSKKSKDAKKDEEKDVPVDDKFHAITTARREISLNLYVSNVSLYVYPSRLNLGVFTILWKYINNRYLKFGLESVENTPKSAKSKRLLTEVNAKFVPGRLNAIMGPSGSGKSTLLNYIAGRLSKESNFYTTGEVIVNDIAMKSMDKPLKKLCSYVLQNDSALIPTLTVRETVHFQAQLRLPKEKKIDGGIDRIIDDLLLKFGLLDCQNIPIGDDYTKGISGGERKRVSIVVQLLDDSKILLLDEPTSGLDSFTSSSILSTLEEYAIEQNKLIIMTIHQPKKEIFEKFGNVVLLARGGYVVYNDSAAKIADYFSNLGYDVPPMTNVADFVLDLVSNNIGERPEESDARLKRLVDTWQENHESDFQRVQTNTTIKISNEDQFDTQFSHLYQNRAADNVSLPVLIKRLTLTTFRDQGVVAARLYQVMALCVIHALFYAPLKNGADGISNRLGLIFQVLNLYYAGFINNISLFPQVKQLLYNEWEDQIYSLESFFASYFLLEIPFEIFCSFLYAVFLVMVIGLPRNAGMLFTTFYASFVAMNCGESFGILFNTLFNKLDVAINVLSNCLIIGIFMAGVMSIHMPEFFQAWNWINPLKYIVGVVAKLGFAGQTFECEIGDECALSTGDDVLRYYRLDHNFPAFMGALAVCFVVYRFVSYVFLAIRLKMS